mgnify:CR=1 FL=1
MIVLMLLSAILSVKIPDKPDFTDFLEKELMKRLKIDKHEDLKQVLEEKYQKDSHELKLLIEDLIILYKMRKKKTKTEEDKEKEEHPEVYVV